MYLKSDQEIELMRASALLVSKTLATVGQEIRPGVSTKYLDKIGETFIRDNGAVPSFLNFCGYPASLCISVNETVVHGIPDEKIIIKEGDIVSVDCGVILNGWHGDSAYTFACGEVSPEVQHLLDVTRQSLELGIEKAVAGNRVGDIGYAIQSYCEAEGLGVVRDLVGHGIGRDMHEEPEIPNYGRRGTGHLLKEGMVMCIEPMINMGTYRVTISEKDGWTVKTADHLPSAHFEKQLAVRKNHADVLTSYDEINKILKKQ